MKLTAVERQLLDPGFRRVYAPAGALPLPPQETPRLAGLRRGQRVTPETVKVLRQPPARLAPVGEADLIRLMKAAGVGRPSTYADVLQELVKREYASLTAGELEPTARGRAVAAFLVSAYPEVFDLGYSARLEAELDELARGQRTYAEVVAALWQRLDKRTSQAGGV